MNDDLDLDLGTEPEKLKTPQTTPVVGTATEKQFDDEIKEATKSKPKKSKKGLKIALGCIGGVVAAGGIGAGIYFGLKGCSAEKEDIVVEEKI